MPVTDCAFQSDAFQNDAFQVCTAVDHRGGYHPIRFEPIFDDDEEIFVLLMTEILLNE